MAKLTAFDFMRAWVFLVGVMAFGNTIQCFVGHNLLKSRLYTTAGNDVNALLARIFGVWTMMSGVLRVYCALDIHNKALYLLTTFSFVLAFVHFMAEITIYGTSTWSIGIITPICISGFSALLMLVFYNQAMGIRAKSATSASKSDRYSRNDVLMSLAKPAQQKKSD